MKIHLIFAETITDELNGGKTATFTPVFTRFPRVAPISLVPSCLLRWISASCSVYTLQAASWDRRSDHRVLRPSESWGDEPGMLCYFSLELFANLFAAEKL